MCLIYCIPDTTLDKTQWKKAMLCKSYVWSLYGSRSLICGVDCYTNLITQQEFEWTPYCYMIIKGAKGYETIFDFCGRFGAFILSLPIPLGRTSTENILGKSPQLCGIPVE
eukprot:TRINITY_DN84257_c0_g1_i1.p1 TRINITY_DN84257_c0_g1~~TRINITY_DN84257_c0_g1_i1.p1  ORF type:complete len:111 (+),score=1.41 TRINITY_DN84257_c0_g1_i1:90-422(+)